MYAGKPIIGIAGGIGSGKTFIARLFGEVGGLVLSADEQVRAAYKDPEIRAKLHEWWGDAAFGADGEIDRRAVARRVFADERERRKLEALLHPWVLRDRDARMLARANDPNVRAFIWDTPLLFEAGLDSQCDAVLFVDSPAESRLARVTAGRGWDKAELERREKSQWALDMKRKLSDDVICNTADAEFARSQIRDIFSRIVAGTLRRPQQSP